MELTFHQHQILRQIEVFMESDASVFILRGYAGTGKTTMVKHIVDYISQSRLVALMAPTGRAARVLSEKTGYDANTIHKTIYGTGSLVSKEVKNVAEAEFKLCFPINMTDGKIVAVVDEASMLCSRTVEQEMFQFGTDNLMNDLLTFVRPSYGGKVIFFVFRNCARSRHGNENCKQNKKQGNCSNQKLVKACWLTRYTAEPFFYEFSASAHFCGIKFRHFSSF